MAGGIHSILILADLCCAVGKWAVCNLGLRRHTPMAAGLDEARAKKAATFCRCAVMVIDEAHPLG